MKRVISFLRRQGMNFEHLALVNRYVYHDICYCIYLSKKCDVYSRITTTLCVLVKPFITRKNYCQKGFGSIHEKVQDDKELSSSHLKISRITDKKSPNCGDHARQLRQSICLNFQTTFLNYFFPSVSIIELKKEIEHHGR